MSCRTCAPYGPDPGGVPQVCRFCHEQMPADLRRQWFQARRARMRDPRGYAEAVAALLIWARQRGAY